jgi:hypothetical protein
MLIDIEIGNQTYLILAPNSFASLILVLVNNLEENFIESLKILY